MNYLPKCVFLVILFLLNLAADEVPTGSNSVRKTFNQLYCLLVMTTQTSAGPGKHPWVALLEDCAPGGGGCSVRGAGALLHPMVILTTVSAIKR